MDRRNSRCAWQSAVRGPECRNRRCAEDHSRWQWYDGSREVSLTKKRLTSFPAITQRMYLWRRLASQQWGRDNEEGLRAHAGDQLAIIERSGRKRLQLELAAPSRAGFRRTGSKASARLVETLFA